ncbi:MAG: dihydrolipoyl dehydrogenase [Candidatus Gastranaerophilales bacterium]|nr:dihydrolipoyl dehydrogenase [Candidatus Gastranaerophilales bacterium]
MSRKYDIVIIGSGPAGYTSAIRASQLGAKTAVIEAGFVGGVCLNRGCIPSKSMLFQTQKFADCKSLDKYGISIENLSFDFAKMLENRTTTIEKIRKSLENTITSNGAEIICGMAKLDENGRLFVKDEQIEYGKLIIATGAKPRPLPGMPFDNHFIINSDTMLCLKEMPETTFIIGSGAIGIEWARILSAMGKKVIIMELADRLAPFTDENVSKYVERIMKKQRIEFYTSTSIKSIEDRKVILSNDKEFEVDKILVAVGRIPNLMGIDKPGFETDRGFIKTDENFKTNLDNVYAIGDITGIQMLAHTASYQAMQLIEHLLLNKPVEINYKNVPYIVYGKPEIACVGYTEAKLKAENIEYEAIQLPLTISAKAYIDGETDSMVKILVSNDLIVGAAIIANDASALLQQLTIAMDRKIKVSELIEVVFPHPTTSEALLEALASFHNKSLHVRKV